MVSYHSKKERKKIAPPPHFIEDLVHMHAASCDPVVLVIEESYSAIEIVVDAVFHVNDVV